MDDTPDDLRGKVAQAMATDMTPNVEEPDGPGPAPRPTHKRRRRVLITVGVVLLALLVTNLLLPDWLLPGQTRTLCESCNTSYNRINGQIVWVEIVDDDTVSVQIGDWRTAPEITGLHVGDSARGPWWWGSITIIEISPQDQGPPPRRTAPSTPKPGEPTLAATPPKPTGGGEVTVRWTPW
jgi:hypothetical protein